MCNKPPKATMRLLSRVADFEDVGDPTDVAIAEGSTTLLIDRETGAEIWRTPPREAA